MNNDDGPPGLPRINTVIYNGPSQQKSEPEPPLHRLKSLWIKYTRL